MNAAPEDPNPQRANRLAQALNRIGREGSRSFSIRTKEGRFTIQKTVYLLARSGYAGAKPYRYSLYLMGPYSPELARDYYNLGDQGMAAAGIAGDLTHAQIDTVLSALGRPAGGRHDFLEGLTTLLDVLTGYSSLDPALRHAQAIKPEIGPETWQEVRAFLRDHRHLTAST